jgi:hypothetical protein
LIFFAYSHAWGACRKRKEGFREWDRRREMGEGTWEREKGGGRKRRRRRKMGDGRREEGRGRKKEGREKREKEGGRWDMGDGRREERRREKGGGRKKEEMGGGRREELLNLLLSKNLGKLSLYCMLKYSKTNRKLIFAYSRRWITHDIYCRAKKR